jgi:DNA-directed RNA polymerase specialized sigma24 family protein
LERGEAAVERFKLENEILGACLRIAEPIRYTLLLRHCAALSAIDISRRLGISVPTVRDRLKRGMDEVAALLDLRFNGNRRLWVLQLITTQSQSPRRTKCRRT